MNTKIIIATLLFQVASIASETIKENIPTEARNNLNQIVWRLMVKDKFDGKNRRWIKNSKYYNSVVKVIGKAIADCVTGINEFKDKKSGDIIWFEGTDPETYTQANFNAVFLYNFIFAYMNYSEKTYNEDLLFKKVLNNFFDKIYSDILNFYKTNYKVGDINHFAIMLSKAKSDIKQYDNEIGLADKLSDFKAKNNDYNNYKFVSNIAPYINVSHNLTDEEKQKADELGIKPWYETELTDKLDFAPWCNYTLIYKDYDRVYRPRLTFVDNKWNIQKFVRDDFEISFCNEGRIRFDKPKSVVQWIKSSYKKSDKRFCKDVVAKIDKLLEGLIKPIEYV